MDEFAHTNVAGSRHAKRWQDVEELLAAGIDVYTTVNVQHIESLNDVVAQITGARMQETVPDKVFDGADEIELIDITPDELLQRLKEGKVYLPERAQHALENFFRKGNLIALRELAMRAAADRVDAEMREYRDEHAIYDTWAAGECLMVCVGPDAQAEKLVRAGKRIATALHARWLVVYVETPELLRMPEAERNRRIDLLRLAESLGAESVTLDGPTAAEALLEYARTRNVNRILVGKPNRHGARRWLRPSTSSQLVTRCPRHRHLRDQRGGHCPDAPRPGARAQQRLSRSGGRGIGQEACARLCLGAGHQRHLHRDLLGPQRAVRSAQSDHGLPARRGDHRRALRPWSCGHIGGAQRCGIRFLFRAAVFFVCRFRHAVPGDLRGHACGDADHRQSHRQRAPAGAGRRPSRAAHRRRSMR